MKIANINIYNNNIKIQKNNIQKTNVQTFNNSITKNNPTFLNTNQYLAFLGGYSLDLNEVFNKLEDEQYPPDIQERVLTTNISKNPENKTLYDVHFEKYKGVLDCFSLEELKEKYPEFENVISDKMIDCKPDSFLGKFKNDELKTFPKSEDLTLQLIKLYWGQGFSLPDLSKHVASSDKQYKNFNLGNIMNKLNIPLMNPRYALVLKLSNKEYNERFSAIMSIKAKEAQEARIQRAEGEAVIIPRGPLSEAHKQHISEGLKKHFKEHPEKIYEMSERQKEFYRNNPEKAKEMRIVMDFAWNKTQEGKSIAKHLSKFMKKYNNTTITQEQLSGIKKMDSKSCEAFGAFWKRNPWAAEKLSSAVKKGYVALKDIKENEKIEAENKTLYQNLYKTIPGEQLCYTTMPPKLRNIIYDWAVERNYDVSDIKIGRAMLYGKPAEHFLNSKEMLKNDEKLNSILKGFFKEHPSTEPMTAIYKQIAIYLLYIATYGQKKEDLPKSFQDDKKFYNLHKFLRHLEETYGSIYLVKDNKITGINHEMKLETIEEIYKNIMSYALTQNHDDLAKQMDKYLDKAFNEDAQNSEFSIHQTTNFSKYLP